MSEQQSELEQELELLLQYKERHQPTRADISRILGLHSADCVSEALEAISEAEALVERFEDRRWCAELHRLRGVFLAALGAEETRIEASFREAIRIAKEQRAVRWRTRRSNLRGIPPPKSERLRRAWIPTTSLITSRRGISGLLAFKMIDDLINDF